VLGKEVKDLKEKAETQENARKFWSHFLFGYFCFIVVWKMVFLKPIFIL
jgi:hypothetical protein